MRSKVKLVYSGGLGNQLFQYAVGMYLETMHPEIHVEHDFFAYRSEAYHNGIEIQKIFSTGIGKDINRAEKYRRSIHLVAFQQIKLFRICRLALRKLAGYKTVYDNQASDPQSVVSLLHEKKKTILAGFFQNPSFADTVREQLLLSMIAYETMGQENDRILRRIEGRHSVSIHIRRGDYLSIPEYNVFNGLNYYMSAIQYIKERIENPIFVIFSNDPEWVAENLNISGESIAVTCNQSEDSYKDLIMMSKCTHNIIANSSFSWWGAWLNQNPDKIVISPEIWFKGRPSSQVVPYNWIKIPN